MNVSVGPSPDLVNKKVSSQLVVDELLLLTVQSVSQSVGALSLFLVLLSLLTAQSTSHGLQKSKLFPDKNSEIAGMAP